jgi:chromosome segregation ATPase
VSSNGLVPTISFTFDNLLPNSIFNIKINYNFNPIWGAFRLTLWIGIIVVIIGSILLFKRYSKKIEGPKVKGNTEIVKNYVNLLYEELGLWNDVDKLEQALDDGSLGRKDYNNRKKTLDARNKDLTESRVRLKNSMRSISPKYSAIVTGFETDENEIQSLNSEFSKLRSQFQSGKISRKFFETQAGDYRRRIRRVTAHVESNLIELRDEID